VFSQTASICSTPSKGDGVKSGDIGVADKKQNDLNLLKFSKTPFIAL
jgi:hypothetical protein